MSKQTRVVKSFQLEQNSKFYFGNIIQTRFFHDPTSCKLTEEKDCIIMEILVRGDNSIHTYRVPLALCVVEYQ